MALHDLPKTMISSFLVWIYNALSKMVHNSKHLRPKTNSEAPLPEPSVVYFQNKTKKTLHFLDLNFPPGLLGFQNRSCTRKDLFCHKPLDARGLASQILVISTICKSKSPRSESPCEISIFWSKMDTNLCHLGTHWDMNAKLINSNLAWEPNYHL